MNAHRSDHGFFFLDFWRFLAQKRKKNQQKIINIEHPLRNHGVVGSLRRMGTIFLGPLGLM